MNAIKEISGTIEKLSEISSTIAAAVEEQGAATQEISRNVQQAAQGTQQVSVQHHRRAARRQRDRIGVLAGARGGAVAVGRQQPPQARGRQVPRTRCGRPDRVRTRLTEAGFSRRLRDRDAAESDAFEGVQRGGRSVLSGMYYGSNVFLRSLKCDCGAQQQIALSENGARISARSSSEGRENSVVCRSHRKVRCHAFSVNEDGLGTQDATFMATRIDAQIRRGQVARMIPLNSCQRSFFRFCDERWRRLG